MDALGQLVSAARVVPPRTANATVTALTAGVATAEIATNVPGKGGHVTIACGVAFDINFGTAGLAAPTDTACFVAGVYSFYVDGNDTKFILMPHANGSVKSWLSSR